MLKIKFQFGALLFSSIIALLLSSTTALAEGASQGNAKRTQAIKASSEDSVFGFDQASYINEQNEIFKELISEQASLDRSRGHSSGWGKCGRRAT